MFLSNVLASPPIRPKADIISTAMLENLAARYRTGGLCLMLMRIDGTLAWHDADAAPFFQKYAVMCAGSADPAKHGMGESFATLTATSPATVWSILPGIALAGIPYVERRQLAGVLVLAAKSNSFRLNDDVVQVCNRFGIDGIWLHQQADELPSYSDEAIQRQARLLFSTVRDQVRLSGLEHELKSISGQLTNTYEELSLIYQISAGMKISRRPAEFFRQASMDSIEVMGVQAMGVALRANDAIGQDPLIFGPKSLAPGKDQAIIGGIVSVDDAQKGVVADQRPPP